MIYAYECGKCRTSADFSYPMGTAPKERKCEKCGRNAVRVFSTFAIGIDGAIDRKSTFGESMRKRNEQASRRMLGRDKPVRTIAHDYGNGDIREA
jgi:putative FmdB family regulatory protein